MKLFSGIDLHSSNSYLATVDETGKRIFKEKAPNDMFKQSVRTFCKNLGIDPFFLACI